MFFLACSLVYDKSAIDYGFWRIFVIYSLLKSFDTTLVWMGSEYLLSVNSDIVTYTAVGSAKYGQVIAK